MKETLRAIGVAPTEASFYVPTAIVPRRTPIIQPVQETLEKIEYSQPPEPSWSNLAEVVRKRTYSRITNEETQSTETWEQTVRRVIEGNIGKYRGTKYLESNEEERLFYFLYNRKAMPAGRGLWFSGSTAHKKLGGAGLTNCWHFTADDIEHFVLAQDLLMLGGGVGMTVEHRYVSKLPRVKRDVIITNKETADAEFIVPDSREGWCALTRKVLKSYFVSGKSFTYSTICIRGAGSPIKGFGGTASGAVALVDFVTKLCKLLDSRAGRSLKPIDASDVMCLIGEMVVAGNVRRSAILILGDCWDKQYLKAKRWDLGSIPTQRAMANFSVVCDDIDDVHPAFWASYENGEPFGIVNRTNMQKFARMGEEKIDKATGVNPCGEVPLQNGEPCNLADCFLPNLDSKSEFKEAARLMFRWVKRVTCEDYHNKINDDIVKKNRRTGVGITGCLQNMKLFNEATLDEGYQVIQKEDKAYSKLLGVPESIRTTTVKPSGSISLLGDVTPGIHPAYSQFYIRRVRFSANDALIPLLREAGHKVEPVIKLDGTFDHNTLIAEFPVKTPEGTPCADKDFSTMDQLELLKMVQKKWSDNAVSVTVYYNRENIAEIKDWLQKNLSEIKTISFLCHTGHGFVQAPYEPITEDEFHKISARLKPLAIDAVGFAEDVDIEGCAGGLCPIK